MVNEVVDYGCCCFFIVIIVVVGGVGVVVVVVFFIKMWELSVCVKVVGVLVIVDISKIEEGQKVIFLWCSLLVFVVNCIKVQFVLLLMVDLCFVDLKFDGVLVVQQLKYVQNEICLIKFEWLVVVGICIYFGCVLDFVLEIKFELFDLDWKGGFYCFCYKLCYDMVGCVFSGVFVLKNLQVLLYYFVNDSIIQIGVDLKEVG